MAFIQINLMSESLMRTINVNAIIPVDKISFNTKEVKKQKNRAEIAKLEKEMKKAAQMLEYEYAAVLRDRIIELRGEKGK